MRLHLAFAAALAVTLVTSISGAEAQPPPVAEWIVVFQDAPVKYIQQQGDTALGSAAGWSCIASLATEVTDAKRVDAFTVACTKGDVEVRTQAHQTEGAPAATMVPLQISTAAKKPVVTIAFGNRSKKAG